MKSPIIASLAIFALSANAGEFKIKELELGTQLESYQFVNDCKVVSKGVVRCLTQGPGITVGGELIKDLLVTFENGNTIGSIYFEYDSSSFEMIKKAILSKYKKIKCSQNSVSNAMGATFVNENCFLKATKETISFEKFSGTIREGALFLTTNENVIKNMAESLSKESDI